jgi:hypothetical protein
MARPMVRKEQHEEQHWTPIFSTLPQGPPVRYGLDFAKRTFAIARIVEGRINTVVLPLGHAAGGMACAGWRKFACLPRS